MKSINQIEEFDRLANKHLDLLIEDVVEQIHKIDEQIRNSEWRKREGYYINGYIWRTIITSAGICKFYRTKYKVWNEVTKKWNTVCLVDDYIQLEKYQKLSLEFINKILNKVSEGMKYKDIINCYDRSLIHKSTISRIIKKMDVDDLSEISADLDYEIPKDVDQYDNVYVSTDDAFLNLKEYNKIKNKLQSSKYRVRLAVLYLGVNKKPDSRNSKLIHKRVVYEIIKSNSKASSPVKFAETIREKIKEFYGNKSRRIIVCGDGDEYIKTVANYLNGEQVLDFWHLKAKIRRCLPFTRWNKNNALNKLCNIIMEVIKTDPQDAIEKYLLPLKQEATHEKKLLINEAIKYINKNLEGILSYQENYYNGCYTESNVYHFVKSISNGKSYSFKTFKNLIALRVGKINCFKVFDIWKHEKNTEFENNVYNNKHIQWYFKYKKVVDHNIAVKNGTIGSNTAKTKNWPYNSNKLNNY